LDIMCLISYKFSLLKHAIYTLENALKTEFSKKLK
jgi:hypothetical protein